MMGSWWFIWMLVMLFLLVPSVGYGWGYRGWGPPFPRYVQRRRGQRAAATTSSAGFDHESWSWGGDLVWVVALFGLLWACSALWWR
jgi:hypothetical protein